MNLTMPARPDDDLLLEQSLLEFARMTRFPVVFGGFVHGGAVLVTHLVGNRNDALRGLDVHAGSGLGGLALAERRPRFTVDYAHSRSITHDYDRSVLAEGISTLLAVPAIDNERVRAVLYGGLREPTVLGGVSVEPATRVARKLGQDLAVSASRPATQSVRDGKVGLSDAQKEQLRDLYAEIRLIASTIEDEHASKRLLAVEERLAGIATDVESSEQDAGANVLLTNRERDVLSFVALGWTNAAAGRALGVTEATVKSYMNDAMRKLHASSRFEAVAAARKRGLLP
ncbi:LuxR C-terminal-related transcriptional regulator [Microbacterium rhizomatis]|nr:LuxR C-terminal-related transcriptional regulator [Microbacterium rhizomatis]